MAVDTPPLPVAHAVAHASGALVAWCPACGKGFNEHQEMSSHLSKCKLRPEFANKVEGDQDMLRRRQLGQYGPIPDRELIASNISFDGQGGGAVKTMCDSTPRWNWLHRVDEMMPAQATRTPAQKRAPALPPLVVLGCSPPLPPRASCSHSASASSPPIAGLQARGGRFGSSLHYSSQHHG